MDDDEYIILDSHECFWANQHKGVEVIHYDMGTRLMEWTLFIDWKKIGEDLQEEETSEFRIDISYCPFCGLKLSNK